LLAGTTAAGTSLYLGRVCPHPYRCVSVEPYARCVGPILIPWVLLVTYRRLRSYDGSEGGPIYLAVKGVVFDVSPGEQLQDNCG
jgi:hypothetical protein